jgi:hypothetical protein
LFASETAERERVNERSFERSRARDDAPSTNAFFPKSAFSASATDGNPENSKTSSKTSNAEPPKPKKTSENVASLFVDGSAEEIQP